MSDEAPMPTAKEKEAQAAKDAERTRVMLDAAKIAIPAVLLASVGDYVDFTKAAKRIKQILKIP